MVLRGLAQQDANFWRSLVLPLAVAGAALAVAIVGAVVVGSGGGIDSVNAFVEGWSGDSKGGLDKVGGLAPYVFALGMASAVNPCGFAMLPAYLGMYLSAGETSGKSSHLVWALARASLIGGSVSLGIVLLFGLAGTTIGLGASFVSNVVPWLGLAIGVALVLFGAWSISGAKIYAGIAARTASRIGNPNQISPKGYFLFGVSYGVASLSCTIGLFLGVVGITATGTSVADAVVNFFLFGLGMASVILALTLTMALFKGSAAGVLRKAMPYIQPLGAAVMLLAGMYIVYYWLTLGRYQL